MTGKEEQNELAVPAIKASARLLLMGSHAHSSQQYFSLMSQVSLSGSCKLPTPSHSHYGALLRTTFPVQLHLSAVCAASLPISSFEDNITSLQPHWGILQYLLMPCVSHVTDSNVACTCSAAFFQFSSAKRRYKMFSCSCLEASGFIEVLNTGRVRIRTRHRSRLRRPLLA